MDSGEPHRRAGGAFETYWKVSLIWELIFGIMVGPHDILQVCQKLCFLRFTVLGMFFSFDSVHFYWWSAKNKVFRYHTKSRDVRQR